MPPFPPGSLENLGGSGGFIYTPPPAFTGTVTFTYLFHTAVGDSNAATIRIHVNRLAASCPITATASDVPIVIPSPGQIVSTITIPPDAGTLVDANLIVRSTHACDTLRVDLRAPDGTTIRVKNEGNTCRDVASSGLFINPLITQFLEGHQAAGTWALTVTDVATPFSGTLDAWSLTLQVTGAAGRCSSLDDNFDDNMLNSALWDVQAPPPVGGPGMVAETNQQLEITNSLSGPSGAGIVGRSSLTGDFDIQVDYHLLNWPESSGYGVHLRALDLAFDLPGGASISRHSSPLGEEQYVGAFGSSVVSIPATGSAGRLRLVRAGTVLAGYAHDGTRWIPVLAVGLGPSADDTRISLEAGSRDPSSPGGVVIAFDNFRINAGGP